MSDEVQTPRYVIGVDVGTGSARAGVFDLGGRMLASAKRDITLYREAGSIVEQSSNEIWRAVRDAVRQSVQDAGVSPETVVGLGFDATCSLVVLGDQGKPLPVGPSEDPERNIIVWMDHRAVSQAERINALGHEVLRYVGGRISPEMETPKLLCLKENRPDVFDAAWQFLDLADYLTWRATGDLSPACVPSSPGLTIPVTLALTIRAGCLIGLGSGLLITKARITTFIATLGVSSILAAMITWVVRMPE